jgi:Protein of unknown function (DUF3795)
MGKESSVIDCRKLAAPCGLYCGACVDYLEYKSCHGCGCIWGACATIEHHVDCDIYKCCVEKEHLETCKDCDELPCSRLIQFCYSPIWTHHLPVIENLRKQKITGINKWLEEQREVWSNDWYIRRWLWLQKRCEKALSEFREENRKV